MSLVETDWLEKNLNDVKIIDCSWHMPQTKRNGYEEYNKEHITGSIFFDLDKNSKKKTFDDIKVANQAGLTDFGENYPQELRDKSSHARREDLNLNWHFIGRIYSLFCQWSA